MKFTIHTDSENYVTSLELTTLETGIEVSQEIQESPDLICYKFINNSFVFDEDKKHRLEIEEEQRQEEEMLKPTTEDLAEALNILASIVIGGNE